MVSRDGKWCSTADVDALGCVESGAMNQRHQPQSQRSARSALSAVDVEQSGTETGRRPRLEQFNQFIVCGLCDGYLIDATTVAHCLHSCTLYTYSCRVIRFSYVVPFRTCIWYWISRTFLPSRQKWYELSYRKQLRTRYVEGVSSNSVSWNPGWGSLKVIEIGAIRKFGWGFTFALYSNYGDILYHLRDIASVIGRKSRNFYTPPVLVPPRELGICNNQSTANS